MVGFILIFGIIMTGATFALVVGQDSIEQVSGFEQSRNAERAMTLLGQDLDHLAFSRSVSSETGLNINNGQIRLDDASEIAVTVENGTTGATRSWTVPTGSIVNDYEDVVVQYENGMVIRSEESGNASLTDPELTCTDDRAIVSVVTLKGDADRQLGSGRVTVDAFLNESTVVYPMNRTGTDSATNATRVSIDVVNSPYEGVWEDHLDEHPKWQHVASGIYECEVGEPGEVYVRQVTIDVEFQR